MLTLTNFSSWFTLFARNSKRAKRILPRLRKEAKMYTNEREKIALSITEAAEQLGISRPTMYQLTRREGFPTFKVGSRTLISRAGLEAWVQAQAQTGVNT